MHFSPPLILWLLAYKCWQLNMLIIFAFNMLQPICPCWCIFALAAALSHLINSWSFHVSCHDGEDSHFYWWLWSCPPYHGFQCFLLHQCIKKTPSVHSPSKLVPLFCGVIIPCKSNHLAWSLIASCVQLAILLMTILYSMRSLPFTNISNSSKHLAWNPGSSHSAIVKCERIFWCVQVSILHQTFFDKVWQTHCVHLHFDWILWWKWS